MVKVQEPAEPAVNEMDSLIQEHMERIRQVLEKECNTKLEKAEQHSNVIIEQAREEAEKTIAQARHVARIESERIIAEAKEEAREKTRETLREAAEVRKESARILTGTREKASRIITEILESGLKQAQDEFSRAISGAMSKTTEIMAQARNHVEQITGEIETNIKHELERLSAEIAEDQTKPQPPEETQNKEAELNSQQSAGELLTPAELVTENIEPETPAVVEKKSTPVKENDDSRLFKGCLKLEMVPPYNQERLEGVPQWLSRLDGLKVLSTGSHAGANRWITTYTVDLQYPIPLLKVLKAVPSVKGVDEQKGNIILNLK